MERLRKLVSVKPVTFIKPIDGADAIECAIIGGGWPVVVKKGEFQVGDVGVYFEVDSFLPAADPRFEFLLKNKIVWSGKEGVRIRTIRLRGQLSQGLIMPLVNFPEIQEVMNETFASLEDLDFSKAVNVEKWEPILPACLAGQVKGMFPGFIPKTDQERIQNLVKEVLTDNANAEFEVTVKLDGSSGTFYFRDGDIGVCSRNLELKVNEENAGNTMIRLFRQTGLEDALRAISKNVAVQAEVMGPGIQGNREQLKESNLFIFDVYDIDNRAFLTPAERADFMMWLTTEGYKGEHVPIISSCMKLPANTVDGLLEFAEGPSIKHLIREGLVYKRVDGKFSFKCISNQFLLKEK
jgi:RNA ligase (TIGR02306 family)